jgi:hypothetical protein
VIWDPLSVMVLFGTPNLQTIDLINVTVDCLLILTTGVASGHVVNLLMVTYRYHYPPMALGNSPRMSSPIPRTTMRAGSFAASTPVYESAWCEIGTPCISLPA